jgi:hypothetical protein
MVFDESLRLLIQGSWLAVSFPATNARRCSAVLPMAKPATGVVSLPRPSRPPRLAHPPSTQRVLGERCGPPDESPCDCRVRGCL